MRRGLITMIICVLMIASAICVWPGCLIRREIALDSGGSEPYTDIMLTDGADVRQTLITQTDYLTDVSYAFAFHDNNIAEDAEILVTLENEAGEVIAQKQASGLDIMNEKYQTLEVEQWIHKNAEYTLHIQVNGDVGEYLYLVSTPHEENYAPGNLQLIINDTVQEGVAYNQYTYRFPLNWKNVLFHYATIIMVGGSLLTIVNTIRRKTEAT